MTIREQVADILRDRFKQPAVSAGLIWDESFMYMAADGILSLIIKELTVMGENPYKKIQKTWRYIKDSDPEYPDLWQNPETGERLQASDVQEHADIYEEAKQSQLSHTIKQLRGE